MAIFVNVDKLCLKKCEKFWFDLANYQITSGQYFFLYSNTINNFFAYFLLFVAFGFWTQLSIKSSISCRKTQARILTCLRQTIDCHRIRIFKGI